MDRHEQAQDLAGRAQGAQDETEPSTHECECPEPCNCDHENE